MKRILFTMVLVGCGTDPRTKSGPEAPTEARIAAPEQVQPDEQAPTPKRQQSFSVNAQAQLPDCTDDREGALAYLKTESRFEVCEASEWTSADMTVGSIELDAAGAEDCPDGGYEMATFYDRNANGVVDKGEGEGVFGKPKYVCNGAAGVKGDKGADGANGVTGTKGAKGDAGTNGTDNHVSTTFDCSGAIYSNRFSSGVAPSFFGRYRVLITNAGDVRASAWISWGAYTTANFTDQGAITTPWLWDYAGGDPLAATASVHGDFDVRPPTSGNTGNVGIWTWALDQTAGTASASYHDDDFSAPSTIVFPLSCIKTTY